MERDLEPVKTLSSVMGEIFAEEVEPTYVLRLYSCAACGVWGMELGPLTSITLGKSLDSGLLFSHL